MRSALTATFALIAALSLADGAAWGQYRMAPPGRDGPNRPFRPRYNRRPAGYVPTVPELLLNDFLQLELKLSDEQVWQIEDIDHEAERRPALEQRRRPSYENSMALEALRRKIEQETHQAMLGALAPAQRERVRQLEVQLAGPAAFAVPAVQEELQLTTEQKEAVEKNLEVAQRDYHDEYAGRGRPDNSPPAAEARRKRFQELSRRALAKQEALLSAEQKKRWAALAGGPCQALERLDKYGPRCLQRSFGPDRERHTVPRLGAAEVAEHLRDELKLTDEQATRIARLPAEIGTAHREEALKLRNRGQELRQAQAAVEARQEAEMARAMTNVLTPEQRQRFEQIKVQVLGPAAWDDPAVRKALKLTDEQKAAINKARAEAWEAVRRPRPAAPRGPAAPVRSGPASPKELRLYERQLAAGYRALQDRIVALLTPEQQKRWRELTGPPVRFRVERDPFGGGRSGGRGRAGP